MALLSLSKKLRTILKWSCHVSLKLTTSSMYALQPPRPAMTLFIRRWKVAGEFFIPNGVSLYWNRPSGVTKAAISLARSARGTCQNPFSKSNLVTNFACPILSMQSLTRGMRWFWLCYIVHLSLTPSKVRREKTVSIVRFGFVHNSIFLSVWYPQLPSNRVAMAS